MERKADAPGSLYKHSRSITTKLVNYVISSNHEEKKYNLDNAIPFFSIINQHCLKIEDAVHFHDTLNNVEDWPRGMGMAELGGGGLQSFWHDVSGGSGGALG